MRAIRSKDTKPEMRVRKIAHALGLRFRLHRKDLPGNPDLVFPRHELAVFVHGCFWHGHGCARGGKGPKSNTGYWGPKIERNRARDLKSKKALAELGWRIAIFWECELARDDDIRARLSKAIGPEELKS
jgi:DNA mismatch endonuclease (patch repair protein)